MKILGVFGLLKKMLATNVVKCFEKEFYGELTVEDLETLTYDSRPSWDEYFIKIAEQVSTRASCPRIHHGCVIVSKSNRILSTGYNGAPSGYDDCNSVGCHIINNHCRRAEHAERNAIYSAAHEGVSLFGSTAYITGQPCIDCLRALISVGVFRIVYKFGVHYSFPQPEQDMINVLKDGFTSDISGSLVILTKNKT